MSQKDSKQQESNGSGTGSANGEVMDKLESMEIEKVIPLQKEEGLIVEKDGHLELEQEVKDKIIKAFKGGAGEDGEAEGPPHKPRIFSSSDETDTLEKKAAAVAVKALEGEIKSQKEKVIAEEIKKAPAGVPQRIIDKIKKERPSLPNAEVIIASRDRFALALAYSPGMIPKLVEISLKKGVPPLIDDAFALGIPVVEIDGWDPQLRKIKKIKVNDEIPEWMYPAAAKALALVYRIKPEATLVRFIRPYGKKSGSRKRKARKNMKKYRDFLKVAPLSIEVSSELYEHREALAEQLEIVSKNIVANMGLIIPDVEIEKAEDLLEGEYIFKIREISYDYGVVDTAMEPPEMFFTLNNRFRALIYNYGYKLLGHAETEVLVENLKKTNPGLVKSLFPKNFTIGGLHFILRGLLREQIPIRDLETILQTIENHLFDTGDPEVLIEYIRGEFSHFLSSAYCDREGNLNVLMLSPKTEKKIMESIKESNNVRWLDLDYTMGFQFLLDLADELNAFETLGIMPVILTSPVIRRFIRKITEASFPHIPILSYSEISPMTPVKSVGSIELKEG